MKITAAVSREKSERFAIEELELGEPASGEVVVRLVGTGVCHTDLVVREHHSVPLPCVLGHEGAGVVERVGERVSKVRPGDHVVLSFFTCGACRNCMEGKPAYCLNLFSYNFGGSRPDGSTTLKKDGEIIHGNFFNQSSFATYALANERGVVKVRKDVPLNILGPLGCGILTGAGAVVNSLAPRAGSSIAVFGTGSVGLSAIMAAKFVGCTSIIGIDILASRLAMARELGATHVIDASSSDVVKKIVEITGVGVNYSLDTTAIPKILRQAVDCLTLTGVCGLIGAAPLGTEVSLDMNMILLGRALRGIIDGDSIPDIFIPQLIELYTQGRFPFDKLIKFYKLEEINHAAKDSEAGTAIKPVLTFA